MFKNFFKTIFFILVLSAIAIVLGRYFLRGQNSAKKLPVKQPESQLTILEGWTVNDIGAYLEKQGLTKESDFVNSEKQFDYSKYAILASKPKNADLEGFLFPDTYRIFTPSAQNPTSTDASSQLIVKMLNNFSAKFTPEMQAQSAKQKMSVFEIVTLASIIEKETGHNAATQLQKEKLDQERKIVSGIFYNRLNINMALESDATVNYVTGKNDPSPLIVDTQINSPYNTYKNRGLPPGPICNPSLSSIMAALYPAETDYLYFLNDSQGLTYYAKTYEQHLLNKQKYLK